MTLRSDIEAVNSGARTAAAWLEQSLGCTSADEGLNCLTAVFADEAREAAQTVDLAPCGQVLAGVPFVAKDLFDIAGRTTMAGSILNAEHAPAGADATAVARLKAAGAVLVGLANMDEYAYGFSTENHHLGPTRNPHDPTRIAGGSSGGSAAAVAAGMVPISLGSDTNGSIRVPASLCGIFGLKPTFGRLSRAGTFPFVASLDHIGPFARCVDDIALVYDVLQGSDPFDPACVDRPSDLAGTLDRSIGRTFKVGLLDGWFRQGATTDALAAVEKVATAFANLRSANWAGAEVARSSAFCMTAIEGASFHFSRLSRQAASFDPAVRDRLLAGALMPAHLGQQVRRVRRSMIQEVDRLFRDFDLLIAPATPCSAPRIGEATIEIDGVEVPVRANLGIYTQPVSFVGLPALASPVDLPGMPIGVQLIAAPWNERVLLQAAAWLEDRGILASRPCPVPEA
ncbi:AtzE family amidohydrolase [Sphingobium terrigena]|uniref:AtzE family amidohydrolase n=1 Tax=Sphingobium terrigena TaxID=2304063 RepID=A0A418YMR4_9SPHN|nr:AtzE family amidohydrolase [Sphingobium terrigena]PZU59267.1 MAG: AtzE family amidohydrolase [Sphingobium sp.]RJG52431.1 AtzE family amidohydrolase [Sphingobium terrigena]